MEHIKCQICNDSFTLDEEYEKLCKDLPYELSPQRYGVCSYECQIKAIRYNAAWKLKETLKNISAIPYAVFQEKFQFSEKGGYAETKYNRMRRDAFVFACGLDQEQFKKLVF